nr:MAG TPA: hypothetical protein [Caudoviricetes sp.]
MSEVRFDRAKLTFYSGLSLKSRSGFRIYFACFCKTVAFPAPKRRRARFSRQNLTRGYGGWYICSVTGLSTSDCA